MQPASEHRDSPDTTSTTTTVPGTCLLHPALQQEQSTGIMDDGNTLLEHLDIEGHPAAGDTFFEDLDLPGIVDADDGFWEDLDFAGIDAEQPTASDGLYNFIHRLLWQVLESDLPDWYLHPIYRIIYPTKEEFDEKCASLSITFVDGLLEMINSRIPPSMEEIKALPAAPSPEELSKVWAVYMHVYELDGRRGRLYAGSATHASFGARPRIGQYEKPHGYTISRLIKRALAQGFVKKHTMLLCWCPKPPPGLVYQARQHLLGLEAAFQMIFYTVIGNKYDGTWLHLMPWSRDHISWFPLCQQLALREHCRGDIFIPPEKLAIITENRAARKRENRNKRPKGAAYQRWSVWRRGYYRMVKQSRMFACDVCNLSFKTIQAKNLHLTRARHKRNVLIISRGGVVRPSARAIRCKELRDNNKATWRYPCRTCVKCFVERFSLRDHFKTRAHAAAAAAADEAIEDFGDELAVDPDDSDYLSEMDSDALSELGWELGEVGSGSDSDSEMLFEHSSEF